METKRALGKTFEELIEIYMGYPPEKKTLFEIGASAVVGAIDNLDARIPPKEPIGSAGPVPKRRIDLKV